MVVVTRRAVVRAAAAAPAALALGCLSSAWGATPSPYRRSTWEPLVGRAFTLVGQGGRGKATLSAVADLPGARAGAEQRFSLEFRGDGALPEGTVTVRRKGFDHATLFVNAIDRGVVATYRQAVINRI